MTDHEITPLVKNSVLRIRDDLQENPYIQETLRVLPVGGYRSAIGSIWNAVVDDLRSKILFRGIHLFNQEMKTGIKDYDDFIALNNDDVLIEGAYKTGVISWEAAEVLKQAKKTRHIFSGHPKSSDPSPIKVLSMIDDCVKYVLTQEYPVQIIDINDYIDQLGSAGFDRNQVAAENAMGDLPEKYKHELANRLFTVYIHDQTPTTTIGNIEFISPILWKTLPKDVKLQIVRRVDQVFPRGNQVSTERAFKFCVVVDGRKYLSTTARKYIVKPLVDGLKACLDDWSKEAELVKNLSQYSDIIPSDLSADYVSALTNTYVGYMGHSAQFSRRDFFSNAAATLIPDMFENFNDQMISDFVVHVKTCETLKGRLSHARKITRVRNLGQICKDKASAGHADIKFLEILCEPAREPEFIKAIR